MITIEHDRDDYVVCRVAGKLTREDYAAAVPELENALRLRPGEVSVLIDLEDFKGWDAGGLWEELKFDVRHRKDFGKVAVVGSSAVEKWGTLLSKPFFDAEIRFFDRGERGEARAWLIDETAREVPNERGNIE